MPELDAIDERILDRLRADARMTNAELSHAVGLSPSACLRRVRNLESRGVIRGYTVVLDRATARPGLAVFVQVALEKQTEDCLSRFERAVRACPEIHECHLMAGSADYHLRIAASDLADYERIHRNVLSALPGVARIQSSFSIRAVIARG